MKTRRRLLKAELLLCLAVASIATVQGQSPSATPSPIAPPTVLQPKVIEDPSVHAGWRRYQLGDQPFFSVILPVAPEATAERAGGSAIVYLYIATNNTALYGASRMEGLGLNIERATDADRQTFFKTYIGGFARGFQESLTKQNLNYELKLMEPKKVTVTGREAFQQDLTVGPFEGSGKLVFAGSGAFFVISIWNPQALAADREAFFNSFQLTGPPK